MQKMYISYPYLEPGIEFWNWVRVPSSCYKSVATVVLVVLRFGVGLMIERSLVRLLARALSSQLGQLSLPSLRVR